MKHYIAGAAIAFSLVFGVSAVEAQTLYNQNGGTVNAYSTTTDSLIPGWYYTNTGAPRYYYANGAFYDPSTQSYGGAVLYPNAEGPSLNSEAFTPGVPNTGVGGKALTMTLALLVSASTAVAGTYYLSRSKMI